MRTCAGQQPMAAAACPGEIGSLLLRRQAFLRLAVAKRERRARRRTWLQPIPPVNTSALSDEPGVSPPPRRGRITRSDDSVLTTLLTPQSLIP